MLVRWGEQDLIILDGLLHIHTFSFGVIYALDLGLAPDVSDHLVDPNENGTVDLQS